MMFRLKIHDDGALGGACGALFPRGIVDHLVYHPYRYVIGVSDDPPLQW